MKPLNTKRFIRISIGVILGFTLLVWVFPKTKRQIFREANIEPRYNGQTLGYWTEHAFRYYGTKRLENADAADAIQNMGNDALPVLVKWIATPNHSSHGIDYASRALNGFQILGPAAKPAIPELIKVIGRNNNWPSTALSYIGKDAVPALTEFLKTNQAPDICGDWRHGIPANMAREYAIETLSRLGTNAEASLPVLLDCYHDETVRSRADVATALVRVGHNHPEKVVPALIELLTNSLPYLRWRAAEGLGTFGSEAKSAIPALITAGHSADSQMQIRAAIAVKRIAPQTSDALVPLITNLTNKDNWVRRNAIFALQSLGTNGLEALPAMVQLAEHDKDNEVRVAAMNFVSTAETNVAELLSILRPSLSNADESIACAAIEGLGSLAKRLHSRELFLELLFESQTNQNQQVRSIADSKVYEMAEKQPDFLIEPLGDANSEIYSTAMNFLDGLRRDVLVMDRKEPEPSTNYQAYVMKELSDANKERFRNAMPLIVKRLNDGDMKIRRMATNILLGIDPKAAKDAGVLVIPPYSFYAN